MLSEPAYNISRGEAERKRLSVLTSLLLIGGASVALWSAIISIIAHIS
ncbi:MAG TPA: hypothetical protein VMF86_18455 [Stellaceae bacterium]|nr:hypothetical protein [Stellaceae bacterium]